MKEALKLALEALEGVLDDSPKVLEASISGGLYEVVQCREAIAAIKEALAQPEQEPVATLDDLEQEIYENTRQFVSRDVMEWMLKRYYTTPPQRKPLTDKQILADETLRYYFGLNGGAGPVSKQGRKIVNAIEAFHNIKEIEK
jgi:hypothetical protein